MSEMRGVEIVLKFAARSFTVRFESGLKFRNGDGEAHATATSDATCDPFENRFDRFFSPETVSSIDRRSERTGRAPHDENRRRRVSGADSDYAKCKGVTT
jgi:hypothetical protein